MLDWAEDTATSWGAEVTGPNAFRKSVAGNSHFLLLGLGFLAGLLATRVPSSPPTPAPPRKGPLSEPHQHPPGAAAPSPAQGLQLLPVAFRIKSGLVGLGKTLSYFGLIRSIQTFGPHPPVSLAEPSPAGLPNTLWPLLVFALCFLLSPPRSPFFSSPKHTLLQRRTQPFLCIQPSSAIPRLFPCSPPSLCVVSALPLPSVRAHGQGCVSAAGDGARRFDGTFVAFLKANFDS